MEFREILRIVAKWSDNNGCKISWQSLENWLTDANFHFRPSSTKVISLYLDPPFTMVDAFLLSYRYLPFLVDFFYIFTYFVWWGDFIFGRLLNYWLWSEKIKKHLHKIPPSMFVDLSSCAHCLSSWYFGSAHSLEKVMGVISQLGGAGSTFSIPIPLAY